MTEKDLIAKLNKLQEIKPDAAWLASNRELLLSQVSNSGAREISPWQSFIINLSSLATAAAKPVYALGAFVLILLGGSVFSHQIFSGAQPYDSMYIARIISEKAKLNTVIDTKERNILAVQFATEHAQDISAVLADPMFNKEENQDQVAKLNESFNREITTVKSHIDDIEEPAVAVAPSVAPSATGTDSEDVQIASGLEEEQGIEVLEQEPIAVASPASSTVKASVIIEEAQQLFDNKEYGAAADKLKEVDELIKK